MHGSKRLRKKLIKQSGWGVVKKRHDGHGCQLELGSPDGETRVVECRTSPQVFNQALQQVRHGTAQKE